MTHALLYTQLIFPGIPLPLLTGVEYLFSPDKIKLKSFIY